MASYPVLANGMAAGVHVHQTTAIPSLGPSVGSRGGLADGRIFYFCLNGTTTALTRGELLVAADPIANHVNQTQTAGNLPAGANSVTVDVGATAVFLGFYDEGYLVLNDGTGEGFVYKIRNHLGVASAGSGTFHLYDEIVTAGDGTTTTSLIQSLYRNPQQSDTDQANPVCGVPNVTIAAATTAATQTANVVDPQFGWVQTWGPCAVLNEMTTTGAARGAGVTQSPSTVGAVEGRVAGSAEVDALIGVMIDTGVDGEFQPVDLRIRP